MRLVRSQIGAAPDFPTLTILQNYLLPRLRHDARREYGLNMPLRAFQVGDVETPRCEHLSSLAHPAADDLVAKDTWRCVLQLSLSVPMTDTQVRMLAALVGDPV